MISDFECFTPLVGLKSSVVASDPRNDRFYYVGSAYFIAHFIKECIKVKNISHYTNLLGEYYPGHKLPLLDDKWLIEHFSITKKQETDNESIIFRGLLKQCYSNDLNSPTVPSMVSCLLGTDKDDFFKEMHKPNQDNWESIFEIPEYNNSSPSEYETTAGITEDEAIMSDAPKDDLQDLNDVLEVQIKTEEHKIKELRKCLELKKKKLYELKKLSSSYVLVQELSNDPSFAFYKMDVDTLMSILETSGYVEDDKMEGEERIDQIVSTIHDWQISKIRSSHCYSSALPEVKSRTVEKQIEGDNEKFNQITEEMTEIKSRVVQMFDMIKSQGVSRFGDLAHIDSTKTILLENRVRDIRAASSVVTQSSNKSKYITSHGF